MAWKTMLSSKESNAFCLVLHWIAFLSTIQSFGLMSDAEFIVWPFLYIFCISFPFCIALLYSEISKKLDRRKKNAPFLYDALGEFALSL